MDWTSHCKKCDAVHFDINNFYCIKNTGACENCLGKLARDKKRKQRKKEFDTFKKWRVMRRYGDNSVKKNPKMVK